jgi:predicted DNA-binding transcriptional regulator YafY
MRADRLLSILLLLQTGRRMTAREMAKRLEVSERTVYRDMDALSAAGVPVSAERGRGGGCLLLDGYRTNLTGLNDAEIQTLFLTKTPRLLADLGLQRAGEAALIKLLATLPTVSRRDAEFVQQRILIDTAGWKRPEEAIPCLPIIQEAIWQEQKVRLTYERPGSTPSERLVDPLGLVAKGSLWYLVGAVEGAARVYRVARIHDAAISDEPCVRPEGFDLAAYWAQSSADFVANLPQYRITLRVAPDTVHRVTGTGAYGRIEETGATDADGWTTLRMIFDSEDEACGYIFRFGTQVEVIGPPMLRARIGRVAADIASFYALHMPASGESTEGG